MRVAESAAIAFAFARAVGMPAMIPCTAKQPRIAGFDQYATTLQKPGELRDLLRWSAGPGGPDAWAMYQGPGVAVGSHDRAGQRPAPRLVVLDIDTRDAAISDRILSAYGRSPLTVRTPGRGTHHYFREPEGVEIDTKVFSSLSYDVKGRRSLCHLPGSAHATGAGRYEAFYRGHLLGWRDLLAGPIGFLLNALPTFNVREYEDAMALCGVAKVADNGTEIELDDDTARQRGSAWLAKRPGAVGGNGGDNHTYQAACGLKDIGVAKHIAAELMEAWNLTCEPPWSERDLTRIVNSAYKYGQTPVGSRARIDESGALEEDAADEADEIGMLARMVRS